MKKLMKYAPTLLCFNMITSLHGQQNESLEKKIEVVRSNDVEPTEIFDDEMGTDGKGSKATEPQHGIGGIPLAPSSY